MVEAATREEVEAHVAAYSYWWKRYDVLITGRLNLLGEIEHKIEEMRANEHCKQEHIWLWNHGVLLHELVYDKERRVFSLPAPIDMSATISSASM